MQDVFGRSLAPLREKKLFLFDMDGTIYLGDRLFDGVSELLGLISARGGRYVFITNNSSRSVQDYVLKLHRLGLPFVTEADFFTSTQATLMLLRERFGDRLLYVQGTRSFLRELSEGGLRVTEEYTDGAAGIVVGYDTELTAAKMETTCRMLTLHDLPYYAANPDWVCPTEFGYVPDCGSMCRGYELATGKRPIFVGKPEPTMIEAVTQRLGYSQQDVLVIGDRLYTDIASGRNAGVDTLCVLSGECTLDEVKAEETPPTYTAGSIRDLLRSLRDDEMDSRFTLK